MGKLYWMLSRPGPQSSTSRALTWIQCKLGKQYLEKKFTLPWESNPGPTPNRGDLAKTRMVLFGSLCHPPFKQGYFGLSGSFKSAWLRCTQVDYAAHVLFSTRPPTKAFLLLNSLELYLTPILDSHCLQGEQMFLEECSGRGCLKRLAAESDSSSCIIGLT